jgi:Flp pilus assembly pilin Flp
MGVDEVEAPLPQQAPQPQRGGAVVLAPRWKGQDLDVDPQLAQLADLVPHPLAALRRRRVGSEVGRDQDAHRLSVSAPRDRSAFLHFVSAPLEIWRIQVLFGVSARSSIGGNGKRRLLMLYALMGYVHAAIEGRVRTIRRLVGGEEGQGTVEYVGLILLVSLLMVGMVAAMKGFNGKQGTELADVIVDKIKEAVDKVTFK